MARQSKWIRRALTTLAVLVIVVAAGHVYVRGFDLAGQPPADPGTTVADLAFVRDGVREPRGRVLAVVTSTAEIGDSGRKAGFELTELARAWYVFVANGYAVDIASPRGGMPPMNLDDGLVAADHAFLNDADARRKLAGSLPLAEVDASAYAAVYFAGGKGTMFDFAGNPDIQRIVGDVHARGGVIGAVCHGPAALLEVRLADGTRLVDGRRLTGFTNAEELFLIENARTLFPYLLQDRLVEYGARFVEGPLYLDNTVVDGLLVTGQNPWSTWSVAEGMIRALGHEPVPRERTGEETAVQLLGIYHADGIGAARRAKAQLSEADRRLLLMHALVAGMQWNLRDSWHVMRLARP